MRQTFLAFVVIIMSQQAEGIRHSTSDDDQAPVDRSRPISSKIVRNTLAVVLKYVPPPHQYHGFCQSQDLPCTLRIYQYQSLMEFHRSLCTQLSPRLDAPFWWNYMNVRHVDAGARRIK